MRLVVREYINVTAHMYILTVYTRRCDNVGQKKSSQRGNVHVLLKAINISNYFIGRITRDAKKLPFLLLS